jgi:hypothetical protein
MVSNIEYPTLYALTDFLVDICITTDWKVLEGVCMIAELLAKSEQEGSTRD